MYIENHIKYVCVCQIDFALDETINRRVTHPLLQIIRPHQLLLLEPNNL